MQQANQKICLKHRGRPFAAEHLSGNARDSQSRGLPAPATHNSLRPSVPCALSQQHKSAHTGCARAPTGQATLVRRRWLHSTHYSTLGLGGRRCFLSQAVSLSATGDKRTLQTGCRDGHLVGGGRRRCFLFLLLPSTPLPTHTADCCTASSTRFCLLPRCRQRGRTFHCSIANSSVAKDF